MLKFLIMLALFWGAFGIYATISDKNLEKQQAQKKQADRRAWAESFYKECKTLDLDSEFGMEKARLILTKKLNEMGFPKDEQNAYLTDAAIRTFYQDGMNMSVNRCLREKQAEDLRRSTPQTAELTKEEKELLANTKELKDKIGRDKRIAMVRQMMRPISSQIAKLEGGHDALLQMGVLMKQSAAQQKTNDWATIGGAVSALAGPAAGAVAAANAISENARIEEANRRNRCAVDQQVSSLLDKGVDMLTDISKLKEELRPLEKLEEAQKTKVVFSREKYTTEKLFDALKVNVRARQTASNAIEVSGTVEYKGTLDDLPSETACTIDGVLLAQIYSDGKHLGKAYLPLPLYGIKPEGKANKISVKGIFDKYMVDKTIYAVQIYPVNLWLMEV